MGNEFLRIYDSYYDMIYRYVCVKVGSRWDAEDITSEVFKKAFEHHGSINRNTKAWLFTVARNTINDFYRKGKHKDIELQDVFCADHPPLEEGLIEADELNCLKKSLSCLEEEELELISMRYFSDLKYQEIADVVGKENDYLRVKVSRTIKKIGNMVMKCLEG